MEKEQKVKGKTVKIRLSYADKGMERYNELLKQKTEFDEEFKPLKAFLMKMGKLPKTEKRTKA